MKIIHIAAMAKNRTIGKDGKIPWDYPEELEFFRRTTKGCPVIMGRKTHESIGRPLPGRLNLVLSRTLTDAQGVTICPDLDTAITTAEESGAEKAFIIGGENVYKEGIERGIGEILLTEIPLEFEGDAFFPELDKTWCETHRDHHEKYDIVNYQKRA